MFFSFSDEFEYLKNFNGTVAFERDVTGPLTTYELVVEIDIEKSGIKIQGYFWAEDIRGVIKVKNLIYPIGLVGYSEPGKVLLNWKDAKSTRH